MGKQDKAATLILKEGISVILPTYKGGKWILTCLDSLANQTLDKTLFEIIVIINGEKDNSEKLVDDFIIQHTDVNLQKIVLEEAGAAHARNVGITHASRQFSTFVDDDDYVSENYLKGLYNYAEVDTITIAPQIIDVKTDGTLNENNYINTEIKDIIHKKNAPTYLELKYTMSVNALKLIPTSYLKTNHFNANLKSGEDVVLFTILAVKYNLNYRIIDLQEKATYYRLKREDSVSRKTSSFSFNVKERLAVIQKLNILLQEVTDKNAKDFIINKIDAQASFIKQYIDKIIDEDTKEIKQTIADLDLTYFPDSIFAIEDVNEKYRQATMQINNYKEQATKINQKYREATIQIDNYKKQITEINQKYREATVQIDKFKEKYREATVEIGNYKARVEYLDTDLIKLKNEINTLTQALEMEKRSKNNYKELHTSASYQLGHLLIHETRSILDVLRLPSRIMNIRSKKQTPSRQFPNKNEQNLISKKPSTAIRIATEKKLQTDSIHIFKTDKKTDKLKIACIMDPFTYGSYSREATFQQLTPEKWNDELKTFSPDLLFIESAWRGKDELWWNTVGKKCDELVAIVKYCNKHNIPTAFWNKEDPVHFSTFINTASLFDFVFTTDIDMIDRYKAVLQHDRVFLLPFACQPKVNNPIEKYERKDAFCFAGAYYVRYPDRTRDLDEFMLHLPKIKPIEIYDRNYGKDDPTYMFPDQFKPFIVGTLPFEEIDKAYKGYNYAINLNSVKQSQSMFARRVYEVLASNTITISNFSRAVRILFGDLVITSDNGTEVVKHVSDLVKDETVLKKHKLIALRKVLSQHTYKDRLEYLVSKVFDREIEDSSPFITMICFVQDKVSYEQCLETFDRQKYQHKNLLIVMDHFKADNNHDDIKIIDFHVVQNKTVADLYLSADYIATIDTDDYYGANYLTDMALSTCYFDGAVIGKGSYYQCTDKDEIVLQNEDKQYRIVNSLSLYTSIVKKEELSSLKIDTLQRITESKDIGNLECLSIDEFNYCKNGNKLSLEKTALVEADAIKYDGISMEELIGHSENGAKASIENVKTEALSGVLLAQSINKQKILDVTFDIREESIIISSMMTSDKHQNIYNPDLYGVNTLGFNKEQNVYLDMTIGLDIMLIVVYLDEKKQKISHQSIMPNQNAELSIPDNAKWIQFGFRVKGPGSVSLNTLELDHRILNPSIMIGQAEHLVLTNFYPSYDDLYRNGFVHARVKAYQENGVKVDVFSLRQNTQVSYYEFENVDVTTGSSDALRNLLENNSYKSILVHFLDEQMWNVLKDYIDEIKVFVWIHGAEIQPWHRREFNYTTQEELEEAKIPSAKRMKFWKSVLGEPHPNLKLIFVSQYFAEEVEEDLEMTVPGKNKMIIHNYINTDLFKYIPKDTEQRKRILSIRPYASRKYANDLSVEVILELSKKPYFDELEFRMIGDGILFDEILEPIKKFSNVRIERRFLTQSEIAALHKEYGSFLTPTRMDAQGVSRDEAMSSGLIPITNGVTAIPEFVDERCGILAEGDDAHGLAEGISKIYENPELFQKMSEAAAKRVREQCGFEQTIGKELELFSPTTTKETPTQFFLSKSTDQGLSR